MEINRHGLTLHSAIHPVFFAFAAIAAAASRAWPRRQRNRHGSCRLSRSSTSRSIARARVRDLTRQAATPQLAMRAAVEDWPRMRQIAQATVAGMAQAPDAGTPGCEGSARLPGMDAG
jgi:glutamate dehydrogenase